MGPETSGLFCFRHVERPQSPVAECAKKAMEQMELLEVTTDTVTIELSHVELMAIKNAVSWVRFHMPESELHTIIGADLAELGPISDAITEIWRKVPLLP